MAEFGSLKMTDLGIALQAKAQAGTELQYTRVGIGDGELNGQSISGLTDLINETMSLNINRLEREVPNKAVITTAFNNQGLAEGFYFREIGIFANDPDEGEILYAYVNAGSSAEFIPADGGGQITEKQLNLITIVGNAENVSAVIDGSLVYVTRDEIGVPGGVAEYDEVQNLSDKSLIDRGVLPSDTDLNTVTEPGVYTLGAYTYGNAPLVQYDGGTLTVTNANDGVVQTLVLNSDTWQRKGVSTTFEPWRRFANTDEVDAVANDLATHEAEGVHQKVEATNTDDATSSVDAPLKSAGGAAIAKSLYVGEREILADRVLRWVGETTELTTDKQWRVRIRLNGRRGYMIRAVFTAIDGSSDADRMSYFDRLFRVWMRNDNNINVDDTTNIIGGFASDDTVIEAVGDNRMVDFIIRKTSANVSHLATLYIEIVGAGHLASVVDSVVENIT